MGSPFAGAGLCIAAHIGLDARRAERDVSILYAYPYGFGRSFLPGSCGHGGLRPLAMSRMACPKRQEQQRIGDSREGAPLPALCSQAGAPRHLCTPTTLQERGRQAAGNATSSPYSYVCLRHAASILRRHASNTDTEHTLCTLPGVRQSDAERDDREDARCRPAAVVAPRSRQADKHRQEAARGKTGGLAANLPLRACRQSRERDGLRTWSLWLARPGRPAGHRWCSRESDSKPGHGGTEAEDARTLCTEQVRSNTPYTHPVGGPRGVARLPRAPSQGAMQDGGTRRARAC